MSHAIDIDGVLEKLFVLRNLVFASRSYADAKKKYCSCFEREALKVLTHNEKPLFEADFDEYYQEVRHLDSKPRPPVFDRGALNNIQNRCY